MGVLLIVGRKAGRLRMPDFARDGKSQRQMTVRNYAIIRQNDEARNTHARRNA